MKQMNNCPLPLLLRQCYQHKGSVSGMKVYFLGHFESEKEAEEHAKKLVHRSVLSRFARSLHGCKVNIDLLKKGDAHFLSASVKLKASLN